MDEEDRSPLAFFHLTTSELRWALEERMNALKNAQPGMASDMIRSTIDRMRAEIARRD